MKTCVAYLRFGLVLALIVGLAPGLLAQSEQTLFHNERINASVLYPNPAQEYVQLDYHANGVQDLRLVFFNLLGQAVKEVNLDPKERSHRLPVRDLNNGMYLYQLWADGRSLATKKLIIRH